MRGPKPLWVDPDLSRAGGCRLATNFRLLCGAPRAPTMQVTATTVLKTALLLFVPLSLTLHHLSLVAPQWVFLVRPYRDRGAGRLGSTRHRASGRARRHLHRQSAECQLRQCRRTGACAVRAIAGADPGGAGADHRLDHRHHPVVPRHRRPVGGLRHERQTFSQAQVGLLSTLLLLRRSPSCCRRPST